MKKILMLLLVCTLVFSLTLTMTSCDFFNNLFGSDDPQPDGGNGDGDDKPGIDSDDSTNIFGGENLGDGGIELPITDVNSQDMTIPPEGTEGGEETAPDAE